MTGLHSVVKLAGGGGTYYALESDGTVWAWGGNGFGQLGNGTTNPGQINTATEVQGLTAITAIAAGDSHALALRSDGTVWAWGNDYNGQLGDGNGAYQQNIAVYSTTPVQVVDSTGTGHLVNAVAIGSGPIATFSLAVTADGSVWDWGSNWYGQLGDGTSRTERYRPFQVPPPAGGFPGTVTTVTATQGSSVALVSNGTVWSWGNNFEGEFGNGTNTDSFTPIQASISGIKAVTAGGGQLLAIDANNALWSWGWNLVGELGNGTTQNAYSPVRVEDAGGTGFLTDVTSIAAGRHHSVAVNTSGTWAWGDNYYGELANGTTISSSVPVGVPCSLAGAGPTTVSLTFANGPNISVKGWTYSPNPFAISLTIQNSGQNSTQNLSVTLSIPSGLSFSPGENPAHLISALAPGATVVTSWAVSAAAQTAGEATLMLSATASADNAPSVTANGTVVVPMVHPRYVAFGDSLTTGFSIACDSIPIASYSTSPWGCPSNPPPRAPQTTAPYPDRVATAYGFSSSDSTAPYTPTKFHLGFPNLDLDRVGIWGYTMQQAQSDYNNPPNAVGGWMPQLTGIERAQDLVTGALGINDMQFSNLALWFKLWSKDTHYCSTQPGYQCGALLKIQAQHFIDQLNQPAPGSAYSPMSQLFLSLQRASKNGARVVVVPYYNPYPNTSACSELFQVADNILRPLNKALADQARADNLLVAGNVKVYFAGHEAGTQSPYVWGTDCSSFAALQIGFAPTIQRCPPYALPCGVTFGGFNLSAVESAFDPHPNDGGSAAIARAILDVAPPP